MWERPPSSPDTASTIVIARWPGHPVEPDERDAFWRGLTDPIAREPFVFGGLLLGEDEPATVGMVFALDRELPDTERLLETLASVPPLTSIAGRRWSRGGRPASSEPGQSMVTMGG
jgi:hypothetical protein